jgi:four helix bundle protein
MRQRSLDEFGAYQKAEELFDLVVADMKFVQREPLCFELAPQQIGSADSICVNIEEGRGRLGRAEYVRSFDFAGGSAREPHGRYLRMARWPGDSLVRQRTPLADETIGILTATIERLRAQPTPTPTGIMREEATDYGQ